ncbi:MAG: hypothetical protein WAV16_04080, partial [Candidatus Moraniibacteriota bacterium]
MQTFTFPTKNTRTVLALGAESAGNFSIFNKNKIYFSPDFGDLLEEKSWLAFQEAVLAFIKKERLTPDIILTDLHPLMKTTLWGKELAKKFKAQHIQIQHHHAHIFCAIGESFLPLPLSKGETGKELSQIPSYQLPATSYGITLDGTGYGTDEKIWGGEVFEISSAQYTISNKITNPNDKISKQNLHIERIGHLENQTLLGGELAIQEPARMLLSILIKISRKNHPSSIINQKKFIYNFVKKYYTQNEFELLYNQLEQNFNCVETSSTGRVLDAVSLLLGFCNNKRKYKHEPIDLLEKNSTIPYKNLKPKIIKIKDKYYPLENSLLKIDSKFEIQNSKLILNTTILFKYLINNLHRDKSRLAATAQLYIAQGLH